MRNESCFLILKTAVILFFSRKVKGKNVGKNPSGGLFTRGSEPLEGLKKLSFFLLLDENRMLLSGFEPESKPRKGLMIGRYTTGAQDQLNSPERIRTSVTG